jgi:hypothetical protein
MPHILPRNEVNRQNESRPLYFCPEKGNSLPPSGGPIIEDQFFRRFIHAQLLLIGGA